MSLDVRAAAATVIGKVLNGQSMNRTLPAQLDRVHSKDQGLLQQLCYGTLRQGPRLQAILDRLLQKPLRNKDHDLCGLLLCGLYQLDSTRVPDHAAVAATVGATHALKKHWAKGMTNAVLRRYLRERVALVEALDAPAAACHPPWLYHKITQQWPALAVSILAANNQQPPMTLRLNTRQESRPAYLAQLARQGIAAQAGRYSPHSVRLNQPLDVMQLPGFTRGCVSVQDEAAQLAAILLQPHPGERILDACAAPGGKACHILELQPQLAELVAMDVDAQRLHKVADNLQRLKLRATVLRGDAMHPPATLAQHSFDRILLDAPCSASGVIRRHPDVKLLRREADIPALAKQQTQLLIGLWPLLKRGGTLLYATCSILEEENSAVIHHFLNTEHEATLVQVSTGDGEPVACGRQFVPAPDGTDGLFYARLQKRH